MTSRPHGRDEVRRAILTAAKRRFATHGPSASTRDIAADADVNLGLLHRHFGTKEALIRAVFADAAAAGYARALDTSSLQEALAQTIDSIVTADTTYARMLAGMLLAGKRPSDLQDEYPTIRRLVDMGGPDERAIILTTLLAVFGWHVFAEFLTDALGYDDEASAAADLSRVLHQLADRS